MSDVNRNVVLFCYADNYLQINIALIPSVPKINTPLWINIWRISIFWIYTKLTVFGKRKSNLNFGASFIRFDQTLIPPESSFMNSTNNFPKISIQIFGTLANNHNKIKKLYLLTKSMKSPSSGEHFEEDKESGCLRRRSSKFKS